MYFVPERLNTNGTADTTSGTYGLAVPILSDPGPELLLLVETNGDILLAWGLEHTGREEPFTNLLARFTSTGALDPTFDKIQVDHLAEAVQYRALDWSLW